MGIPFLGSEAGKGTREDKEAPTVGFVRVEVFFVRRSGENRYRRHSGGGGINASNNLMEGGEGTRYRGGTRRR